MRHPVPLMRPGRAARVVNALAEWNEPLTADELHEKYCKMDVSPFVFYRLRKFLEETEENKSERDCVGY
jgi:uncharacterized protein (DUF2252 family)